MASYPVWIDEYAKSFHNAFSKMVPNSWGPIDFYGILSALQGAFTEKLYEAVTVLKEKKLPLDVVGDSFSCPSTLRVALYFIFLEYQMLHNKERMKKMVKEIADYLTPVLQNLTPQDIFAYNSNRRHSAGEIQKILESTPWQSGNLVSARELGELYTSLASLVFALYRDFFPQDGQEIYGSYDVSSKFGPGTIMTIKHFIKLKPVDLWAQANNFKYQDVKIFQVYRDVQFSCEVVGMHSLYAGDLMNGLIRYAVIVDGRLIGSLDAIKELSQYFAELATNASQYCDAMTKTELKRKALEWECYQFFNFFKLADIDWRPTQEMQDRVKDAKIKDRAEEDSMPDLKTFEASPDYEVYWMKSLYN